MFNQSIFSAILGLSSHWCITDVKLAEHVNRLEVKVGASAGARFGCPVCQGAAEIVDEKETLWLHENLFNLRACITAILPVTSCRRCGINRVTAPWERPHSQFRPLDPQTETF